MRKFYKPSDWTFTWTDYRRQLDSLVEQIGGQDPYLAEEQAKVKLAKLIRQCERGGMKILPAITAHLGRC